MGKLAQEHLATPSVAPAAPLGWTPFTLPSRGVLNGDKLPEGKIQIRKMKSKQQALLEQQGGGLIGKLDALVSTCVKLPEGMEHKDMLLTDRFATLLALRTVTYGPVYSFRWQCIYCNTWGHETINIVNDLEERAAAEDLTEPFDVQLTNPECTLQLRFLRGTDEKDVAKYAKRMKMNNSQDPTDPSRLYRTALQLEAKDGEPFRNILDKQRFVEDLDADQLIILEDAITAVEPAIDTRLYLECANCEAINEKGMPFEAEFFRPKRRNS